MSLYALIEPLVIVVIALLALHRLLRHVAPSLLPGRRAASVCHTSTPGCPTACNGCPGSRTDSPR